MGLYGQKDCIYHYSVPNPYYLVACNNPEIKADIVTTSFCNNCNKIKRKEYETYSLMELIRRFDEESKKGDTLELDKIKRAIKKKLGV